MKLELLKDGSLQVTISHNNLKDLPESKSRLSKIVATTGAIQSLPVLVNGKQEIVRFNLTAFIDIPGRKKLKDGSTVDVKTGEVLVAPGM